MATKMYVCEARDGSRALTATPQLDGSNGLVHYLVSPTQGTLRGYAGQVNGTTILYLCDYGPLGEGLSAT